MKALIRDVLLILAFISIAALSGGMVGAIGGHYAARHALAEAATEPAQAKVIFPRPDHVEIQVPTVVRGRRVTCLIFADVKRRISSISC